MSRGAEPIETQLLPVAGDRERTPADEAGAEQWGESHIASDVAEREREPCIGDCSRREAAVTCVTGKEWLVTQVLAVPNAIRAYATGMAKPGNADALAHV